MELDLAGALRRLKPEKRTQPLARRPDHELTFIDHEQLAGPPLLLDTTVYIDLLQDRAPPELEKPVMASISRSQTPAFCHRTKRL